MQPTTLKQRIAIANEFMEKQEFDMPLVVDSMSNDANDAYAGWPERLYVIGSDRKVAYKGGVGPFGFKPDELEQWLEKHYVAN